MTQTVLTEKDLRRLRENRKATLGLWFSLLAILASLASFVYPIASTEVARWAEARQYLDGLVQLERPGPYLAQGAAEATSPADTYAEMIGRVWEVVRQYETDFDATSAGTVSGDWGTYEVCFPGLDVFPSECSTFSDFEFSENGKVSRFTVDGLTLAKIFAPADYGAPVTSESEEGNDQIQAFYGGRLFDPSGSSTTVLVWFHRHGATTAGRSPLTFDSVTAENGAEEGIDILASYFPPTAVYWENYFAVVRVPRDARFLQICWSGVPADESGCDWTFNLT